MYVHTLIRKFSRKKLTGLKLLFMYLGQKVHLFRPSVSFLAEAQPRFETGKDERHFLGKVTFLRRPHELQSKRHWKNYKFILHLPFSKYN
jgi:hypothetical protein